MCSWLSLPVNLVSEVVSDQRIVRNPFACCQGKGLVSLHWSIREKYSLSSELSIIRIILIKIKTCKLDFSSTTCWVWGMEKWKKWTCSSRSRSRSSKLSQLCRVSTALMFLYFTTIKKVGGEKSPSSSCELAMPYLSDLVSTYIAITQHTTLVVSSHFFEPIMLGPTSGLLHLRSPLPRMLFSLPLSPPPSSFQNLAPSWQSYISLKVTFSTSLPLTHIYQLGYFQ